MMSLQGPVRIMQFDIIRLCTMIPNANLCLVSITWPDAGEGLIKLCGCSLGVWSKNDCDEMWACQCC